MRLGLAVGLLALVALEVSLLDKLLGFRTNIVVVSVREGSFHVLADGIPSAADFSAAGDTDLGLTPTSRRAIVLATVPIGNGCRRSSPIKRALRDDRKGLGCLRYLVGLPRTPAQCQIRLFEALHIELEGVESGKVVIDQLVDAVHCGRLGRQVLLTPDSSCHSMSFVIDCHSIMLVSSGALDWRNIEAQHVPSMVCTLNMNRSSALLAGHTCSVAAGLADLACLRISRPWDQRDAFCRTQRLGRAEFDLGRKHCAGSMNPVVVSRPLESFSGIDGPTRLFLPLAVIVGSLEGRLPFGLLPFLFLLRLLLVRHLRQLNKIILGVLNRTQYTFVVDGHLRILVVETCVACPLARCPLVRDAIAWAVHTQAALLT